MLVDSGDTHPDWSRAPRRRRWGTDSIPTLLDPTALAQLASLQRGSDPRQASQRPCPGRWGRACGLQRAARAPGDSHAPLLGLQGRASCCLTAWCRLNTVLMLAGVPDVWELPSQGRIQGTGIFSILWGWGQACDSEGTSQELLPETPLRSGAVHGHPSYRCCWQHRLLALGVQRQVLLAFGVQLPELAAAGLQWS